MSSCNSSAVESRLSITNSSMSKKASLQLIVTARLALSGRLDSNQRPPEPHSGALAKLRHAPSAPIVDQRSLRAYPSGLSLSRSILQTGRREGYSSILPLRHRPDNIGHFFRCQEGESLHLRRQFYTGTAPA